MARFRLWKFLSIGIVFITLLNAFLLLSCKFSDSGCILNSHVDQESQKHLPHVKQRITRAQHRTTDNQNLTPERQDLSKNTQVAEKEGPRLRRQKYDHDEKSYEEWRKEKPNNEMIARGSLNDASNKIYGKEVLIAGYPRNNQAFLVIGVPTVKRKKVNYLMQTIRDLVKGLENKEIQEVIIVVFITDFDPTSIKSIVDETSSQFESELESGLLRIIKADKKFYPSLSKVPRLWGDSPERVHWRAKQCLDYAFLFRYCKDLGHYYMQIEDDVTISSDYLKRIKETIEKHKNRRWSILEFGARGFIGMMYRSENLDRLSKFVKMYHWVWPVDLLYRQFNDFHLYGNPQWARYKPPLIRHIGAFSSLDGQVRRLEDIQTGYRTYKDSNNPQARITTSIRSNVRGSSRIAAAYDTAHHGIFWGTNIKKLDHILIDFVKPVRVTKVVVESGSPNSPEDYFGAASIEYSPPSADGECGQFMLWHESKDKPQLLVEIKDPQGTPCKCINIIITDVRRDRKGRTRWLVVREIAVWTNKSGA